MLDFLTVIKKKCYFINSDIDNSKQPMEFIIDQIGAIRTKIDSLVQGKTGIYAKNKDAKALYKDLTSTLTSDVPEKLEYQKAFTIISKRMNFPDNIVELKWPKIEEKKDDEEGDEEEGEGET